MSVSDDFYKHQFTQLFKRIWEMAWNNEGCLNYLDAVLHPDFMLHHSFAGNMKGMEKMRKSITDLASAFSDFKIVFNRIVLDGEYGAVRFHWTGTHDQKSQFFPLEPTGKQVYGKGNSFIRIQDGWVTDEWAVDDMADTMAQLGVFPKPGMDIEFEELTWED